MDNNRALTALLSSLLSDLLPLLFISGDHFSSPSIPLSPLLISLLSISQSTTTISLLSHKRKRLQSPQSQSPESDSPNKHRRRTEELNPTIPRSPDSFNLCFNMNSSTFEWLSSLLEPLLECRDPVNSPLNLPVETRLGVGLFRLATGSDYAEISRRFDVSESVVKFCVNQFCRVLCTDFRFWVGFPAQNELDLITKSFESITGLPNCCGVLHCTRFNFTMLKNGSVNEHESIAAQIVADSSSKILNISAGFNGRKSNHLILKSTSLYNDIELNGLLLNSSIPQYLIGDHGYPLLPWLMVPYDGPLTNSHEENFNSACDLMMVSAFRTVDSLKKWGVLRKLMKEEVKTMVGYIGACSILHNALLSRDDYSCLSDKSDEFLRLRQRCEDDDRIGVGLQDDFGEEKVCEIRNVLAARARRS